MPHLSMLNFILSPGFTSSHTSPSAGWDTNQGMCWSSVPSPSPHSAPHLEHHDVSHPEAAGPHQLRLQPRLLPAEVIRHLGANIFQFNLKIIFEIFEEKNP